jgi:hypothetical protein
LFGVAFEAFKLDRNSHGLILVGGLGRTLELTTVAVRIISGPEFGFLYFDDARHEMRMKSSRNTVFENRVALLINNLKKA